jgi:hypothetical protein
MQLECSIYGPYFEEILYKGPPAARAENQRRSNEGTNTKRLAQKECSENWKNKERFGYIDEIGERERERRGKKGMEGGRSGERG